MVAPFLVVHLFSGRRRANDFHARLTGMVQGKPYDVHVLSLDTAIDKTSGNLASTSITWRKDSLVYQGDCFVAYPYWGVGRV